jgi:hypothetical protein
MLSGCEDERGRKINKNMSNGEYRYLQYWIIESPVLQPETQITG